MGVEERKKEKLVIQSNARDSRKRGRDEVSQNQASLASSSTSKPSKKFRELSTTSSSTTSSPDLEAPRSTQSTFDSKISSSTSNSKSMSQISHPPFALPLPLLSNLTIMELSNFLYSVSPSFIPLAPILYNEIGINSRLSLAHFLTIRSNNRLDLLSTLNLSDDDNELVEELLGLLVKLVKRENKKSST